MNVTTTTVCIALAGLVLGFLIAWKISSIKHQKKITILQDILEKLFRTEFLVHDLGKSVYDDWKQLCEKISEPNSEFYEFLESLSLYEDKRLKRAVVDRIRLKLKDMPPNLSNLLGFLERAGLNPEKSYNEKDSKFTLWLGRTLQSNTYEVRDDFTKYVQAAISLENEKKKENFSYFWKTYFDLNELFYAIVAAPIPRLWTEKDADIVLGHRNMYAQKVLELFPDAVYVTSQKIELYTKFLKSQTSGNEDRNHLAFAIAEQFKGYLEQEYKFLPRHNACDIALVTQERQEVYKTYTQLQELLAKNKIEVDQK